MLLAINIGNTNVACGVFHGARLVKRFSFPTASCSSAACVAGRLMRGVGRAPIDGVAIGSVVPRAVVPFRGACQRLFQRRPLVVTPAHCGMKLRYDTRNLGVDRVLNARAAWEKYRRAAIVVDVGTAITFDAGTAITFDVVTAKGVFLGGAIAPGMALAAGALAERTAKLPRAAMTKPKRAIGRSTAACLASGIHHGWAGLVDRIVEAIAREMRTRPLVIATGGAASAIAKRSRSIDRVDPLLTLEGLRLAWERNR